MISTAIILAAGSGSRLRPHLSDDLPKGALEIGGKSMAERSIQTLLDNGITRIIIGTGHAHAWYDTLAKNHPEITCIYNPIFNQSGSMHTLNLCSKNITDPFLLLESDLIYETRAITNFQDYSDPNIILATPYYNLGDEVFIHAEKNHLINMSKTKPNTLEHCHVLAGITKCSPELLTQLCTHYTQTNTPSMNYEDALINAAKITPITIINNPAIHIMEVDDPDHLKIAHTKIQTILQNNAQNNHENKYLLNPGPATTSQAVKMAQVVPDICPREPGFNTILADCCHKITTLAAKKPTDIISILIPGSGTAAVESMLCSALSPTDHCLIIDQGAYGKRIQTICEIHNITHNVYTPNPLKAIPLDDLEAQITTYNPTHIAIVHHETSTGLLNPLKPIGNLAKKHQITLCVDAMSSFGAVDCDMHEHNISFCAASSNKNIQGMPGIGIVITTKNTLENIKSHKKRSLYLDLHSHYDSLYNKNQALFTPPVQCLYALQKALQDLQKEGIQNRYTRYQDRFQQLHECMTQHGFQNILDENDHGKLITAYPINPNFSFENFHKFLYHRHITIYPGKIPETNSFRIANIGELTQADTDYICTQINAYFS